MSDHLTELEQHRRTDSFVTYPMKWYKFLIYFSLIVGALFSLVNVTNYLTGSVYYPQGYTAEGVALLYSKHSGLKTLDTAYAVTCLCSAVLAIITRQRLKRFHRTAPTFVYVVPIFNVFCSSMYSILSCAVVRSDVFKILPQVIGSILGVVLYVWLNYIYFNKRRALFRNC